MKEKFGVVTFVLFYFIFLFFFFFFSFFFLPKNNRKKTKRVFYFFFEDLYGVSTKKTTKIQKIVDDNLFSFVFPSSFFNLLSL